MPELTGALIGVLGDSLTLLLAEASALTTARGLAGVIIGVGALIFFHELGHYLAARWAGVKVEIFSLGFGTRLFGYVHNGTDYRVSMLPLGGYVKMLGQAEEDPVNAPTDREDDFRNKSVGKRFVILVAGVVMNVILAAIGFVLAFGIGLELDAAEIGAISPGSAARASDLRPGDIVVRIDGKEILGWQDVRALVALSDGPMGLEILREGKVHHTTATPIRGKGQTFAQLGITRSLVLGVIEPDSPLDKAGVKGATPTQSERFLNVSPVTSRVDPQVRMAPLEISKLIAECETPLAITIERTTYDPVTHLPTASETFGVEVQFPRLPTWTLGLDIPDVSYVRAVSVASAAEAAGVKVGDRVVSLGGLDVTRSNLIERVHEAGANWNGKPGPLVVERPDPEGGKPTTISLTVTLKLENPDVLDAALHGITDEAARREIRRADGHYLLGVSHRADVIASRCELPLAKEGAEPIVLEAGDRIVTTWLDGGLWWNQEAKFISPDSLEATLNAREDEPLRIDWIRKGSETIEHAVVKAFPHPTRSRANVGYGLMGRQLLIKRGPLGACQLGLEQTWIQTRRIVRTLQSFFTGAVSPKELGGPIQIARISYAIATRDSLAQLLQLLAILSVNLAVINILPIPVLDGGHIFFLALEKLKGRPVSADVMIWAQWIGLLCILVLMALVFFNDIVRWGQ